MTGQTQSTLDLEQQQNQRTVRREWWVERVGWLLIAAVVIAALLGFLGPGPLTHRRSESNDGRLIVEYYAVRRYSAPAELKVFFEEPSNDGTYVDLALSSPIIDAIELKSITPAPIESRLDKDRVVHRFAVADLTEHGKVIYRFDHESFGLLRGTITLLPDSQVELSQFICP